ncbi:MAG: HAD-IB family hydrolase, partial [Gordonia amarae]
MGDTQDADQTGSGAGTDGVDSRADQVDSRAEQADSPAEQVDSPAQEQAAPLPDDWEAQAEIVDPDGAADDPNDGDAPEGDAEIDEASRVTTWISERASAASGRFRQTAAE